MYTMTITHSFYVDQRGKLHHADRSIRLHRFLTGCSESKARSDISSLVRNTGRNTVRVQYNVPKRTMNEKATWILDYVLSGSNRVYTPTVHTLQGFRDGSKRIERKFEVA